MYRWRPHAVDDDLAAPSLLTSSTEVNKQTVGKVRGYCRVDSDMRLCKRSRTRSTRKPITTFDTVWHVTSLYRAHVDT